MGLDRDDKPFDVLDLIINQLREHERKIDIIVERLESISEIDIYTHRRMRLSEPVYQRIILKRWDDFKRRCTDAELFSFLVDEKSLKIMAMIGGNLNVYFEMLPDLILYMTKDNSLRFEAKHMGNIDHIMKSLRGYLDCGLRLLSNVINVKKKDGAFTKIIVYSINSQDVKTWLSKEMGVDPSFVIEGEMVMEK